MEKWFWDLSSSEERLVIRFFWYLMPLSAYKAYLISVQEYTNMWYAHIKYTNYDNIKDTHIMHTHPKCTHIYIYINILTFVSVYMFKAEGI